MNVLPLNTSDQLPVKAGFKYWLDMMYLNRDGKAFTTTTVEKALL